MVRCPLTAPKLPFAEIRLNCLLIPKADIQITGNPLNRRAANGHKRSTPKVPDTARQISAVARVATIVTALLFWVLLNFFFNRSRGC